MKHHLLFGSIVLALGSAALAKLPAPVLDDAAKAKAAETAAKTAWQAKVDGYLLCKAQDKVVASYRKTAATPMAAASAKPAMPAATPAAAAASGTPVAAAPPSIAACTDPGPFAYNPPSQTPLETSGAHSPAGTAKAPPSVKQEAIKVQPAASAAKKS
ncbi:hypothetical protein [Ramlibacter sp.]|uniref:hypothetical protein n=1 Tax=Ramlibacter sp. TaxID=1917967 RepID=UPI003D0B6858